MSAPPRSHGMRQARPSAVPRTLMGPGGVAAAPAWRAHVLTLFPEMFPGPLGGSLTGKALAAGLWGLEALDIRSFARDKHRTVDDTPFGGGPGMVMRPDILAAAIDAAGAGDRPVIYASPRGRPFTQARARELASGVGAVFICGRYEGVDERVLEARGVEEICVGDAVLTGGEIPVMAMIDASVRLLPGVLGAAASLEDESFSRGLLEHPQYTRPPEWEGRAVPEVLLSGHHAKIAAWRTSRAEGLTQERRPDLWAAYEAERDPELSDASSPEGGKDKGKTR